MNRFDIVIINHKKLDSIIRNIHKVENFNQFDRITIISDSETKEEVNLISELEIIKNTKVNYIPIQHGNQGNQRQMLEYMCGRIGSFEENLKHDFLFFMQDHYLDTESSFSMWGEELGFKIKSDVVPDGISFNLDSLYNKLKNEETGVSFCDRGNPCWFSHSGKNYVAPSGSNFIASKDTIRSNYIQKLCARILEMNPKDYNWAVYVEFMMGPMFFFDGVKAYDIKRDIVFSKFEKHMFNVFPIDLNQIIKKYGWPIKENENE